MSVYDRIPDMYYVFIKGILPFYLRKEFFMLSILVHGCNGKMGQEVISQMQEYKDLVLLRWF